jgi:hypothetical protein
MSEKTGHKPSYHGCLWLLSSRKRVPSVGKSARDTPCSHCWVSHKNTKLHNHKLYAEDQDQIHMGFVFVASVSASPYEPSLADSVAHVLVVFSTPWLLQTFLSLFRGIPLALPSVKHIFFCSVREMYFDFVYYII